MDQGQFLALQDFSLLHSVQTDYEAHPASYPGALSMGVKWQGCEADHLPPSSAKVKKGGVIPPLPHMTSWHSVQIIKHRDNFTFYLYQSVSLVNDYRL
jgi:hypothetical protein